MSAFVLGLLVGFLISMLSVIVGAAVHKGIRRVPEPPKPICLCHHAFGSHEDGNKCQVYIHVNYEWKNCACTTYVGPDPITSGLWVAPKSL